MFRIKTILITLLIMIPAMPHTCASFALADNGVVEHASNLEEFIDATEASTSEINSKGISAFASKRIKVKKEINTLEGAEKGVSYKGETLLSYATEQDTEDAFQRLVKKYGAENVIPDFLIAVPQSNSWGMDYMNLDDEKSREIATYGDSLRKVTVAVIDSGVNKKHEVFKGTTFSKDSKNVIDSSDDVSDDTGHGTKVSGIIAETTPDNVEIMSLKVFGANKVASTEDINQAVQYAAEKGADVINLSMGASLYEVLNEIEAFTGINPQVYLNELEEDLKNAALKRILICAASGNDIHGHNDIDTFTMFPAYSRYTITVAAIDKNGKRSSFSNYGQCVDFCAPGEDVVMASNSNNYGYIADSGTSFATPYISACCAYIKMNDPTATVTTTRLDLKNKAVDFGPEGWDKYYGWGMPYYEDFADNTGDEENKEEADQAAADAVSALIRALPDASGVTISDKDAINQARAAYDNLTTDQKDRIEPYTLKKLTDAEEALKVVQDAVPVTTSDDTDSPKQHISESTVYTPIIIDSKSVKASLVQQAIKQASSSGLRVDTLILGKKVKKISKSAFKGTDIKTVVVTTKRLKKKSVKASLKGSKVTTVRVKVGKAKTNKRYVKKYKKYFTKKNAGRKVKVKAY